MSAPARFGATEDERKVLDIIRALRLAGCPNDEIQAAMLTAKLELEQRFGPGAAA